MEYNNYKVYHIFNYYKVTPYNDPYCNKKAIPLKLLKNSIKKRKYNSWKSRMYRKIRGIPSYDGKNIESQPYDLDIDDPKINLKDLISHEKNMETWENTYKTTNIEFICPDSSALSTIGTLYRSKTMDYTIQINGTVNKIIKDMKDHFVFIVGHCYGGAIANKIAVKLAELSEYNPSREQIGTNYSVIACNSLYVPVFDVPRLINYMYINDFAVKFTDLNNPSASQLNTYITANYEEGRRPFIRLYKDPRVSHLLWYCRPTETGCKTKLTKPTWLGGTDNDHNDYTFIFKAIFTMFNNDNQIKKHFETLQNLETNIINLPGNTTSSYKVEDIRNNDNVIETGGAINTVYVAPLTFKKLKVVKKNKRRCTRRKNSFLLFT